MPLRENKGAAPLQAVRCSRHDHFTKEPRLIAGSKIFGGRWFLFAMREQLLEPLGETSCFYHNTDRLTGLLAPMVFLCFGRYMRVGFTDVGEGLKRQAEALYQRSKPSGGQGG